MDTTQIVGAVVLSVMLVALMAFGVTGLVLIRERFTREWLRRNVRPLVPVGVGTLLCLVAVGAVLYLTLPRALERKRAREAQAADCRARGGVPVWSQDGFVDCSGPRR